MNFNPGDLVRFMFLSVEAVNRPDGTDEWVESPVLGVVLEAVGPVSSALSEGVTKLTILWMDESGGFTQTVEDWMVSLVESGEEP